jgi:hypothetical protein
LDGAETAERDDRLFRGHGEFQHPFPVGSEVHGSKGPGIDPDFPNKNRQQAPFPNWLAFPLDDPDLRPGVKKNPVTGHVRDYNLN